MTLSNHATLGVLTIKPDRLRFLRREQNHKRHMGVSTRAVGDEFMHGVARNATGTRCSQGGMVCHTGRESAPEGRKGEKAQGAREVPSGMVELTPTAGRARSERVSNGQA